MVKLLIVTGYLGSGKTTLLRNLQAHLPKEKCHFIVNEAGRVALDHASYEMVQDVTTVVSGGCACCVKKEQLLESVKHILDSQASIAKNDVHYIVVETSGLANPAPIIFSIKSHQYLKHHIDVMGVVCVLGSVEGQEALAHYDEVGQQLAMADAVIMSKSDLVTADRLEILRGIVNGVAVRSPIFIAQNGTADWSSIIGGLQSDRVLGRGNSKAQRHAANISTLRNSTSPDNNTMQQQDVVAGRHGGMSTCVLRIEGSLDWVAFGIWLSALLASYGESIVRVKGVVRVADWDGQNFYVLINCVQHIVYPPQHVEATELSEHVALIFIMRNITPNELVKSLREFHRRHVDDQPILIWAE